MPDRKHRDPIEDRLQEIERRSNEHMRDELAGLMRELGEPDDSRIPEIASNRAPYGTAARVVSTGEERAWEDNAHYLGEAERKHRSYLGDRRFAEWFRAVCAQDHEAARRADPEWARTLTTAAGGDGLVAPGYFASLVFLKERDTGRIGPLCTQVPTGDTSVRIPYEKTVPTALAVAEGGDMTNAQTEPDWEAKTVTPIKVGQVFTVTRELTVDSPLPLVSGLASRVAHAVGEAEDDLWINSVDGGGLDFGTAGGLVAGLTTSSDTWEDNTESLVTVVSKLFELPRDVIPRARWLINIASAKHLSTTVDLDGTNKSDRPIMLPGTAPGSFMLDTLSDVGGARAWGSLAGLPVSVFKTGTGGMPANKAVLVDLRACARVVREALYIDTDKGSGFVNDLIRVHVSRRVGGCIMQATHGKVF